MFRFKNKLFITFGQQVPSGYKHHILDSIHELNLGRYNSWIYSGADENVYKFSLYNISAMNIKDIEEMNELNLVSKTRDSIYKSICDIKNETEPYHNDFGKKIDIKMKIVTSVEHEFDE